MRGPVFAVRLKKIIINLNAMNHKRAMAFGVMVWVWIFAIFSVLMFLPGLQGREWLQTVIFWISLIPLALLAAKWYFRGDPPSAKKGFWLGLYGLVIGTILDLVFTIPAFIKSYSAYYSDWTLYVSFALFWILCILAGAEFDKTFTRDKV